MEKITLNMTDGRILEISKIAENRVYFELFDANGDLIESDKVKAEFLTRVVLEE